MQGYYYLHRRILCDRKVPVCSQCTRSNRACNGYGLRLSWPKANDNRRTVIGREVSRNGKIQAQFSNARQVNITHWDIEMHDYLMRSTPKGLTRLILRPPMPFDAFNLDVTNKYLFQYFECTASSSLTTFGHDPKSVGAIAIRMALTDDSPSARAVLWSLLALSSLHRYGLQLQAAKLKISAIKALVASSKGGIGAMEAAQHIAAGMLLCSFEIHQASCTSGQWLVYIDGVKRIIKAYSSETFKQDGDFRTLLDWVYYHDTLSRFSMSHWQRSIKAQSPQLGAHIEIPHSMLSPCTKTLALLSEGCDTLATAQLEAMSASQLDNYRSFMRSLGWRIQSISTPDDVEQDQTGKSRALELFQLATMVYLNRLSGKLLELPIKTQQMIRRAFALFLQLGACERQFPLFVLGCEARTDAERCIVLDLLDRTEEKASSRSLCLLRRLIQAVWVQDDLAQGEVDYKEKLGAIMSCCSTLPTFV